MDFASMFGAVTSLSVVLERLVELLIKPVFPVGYKKAIPYASAILGLAAAFTLSLDLVTPLLAAFDVTPAVGWAGKVITGLLMGGGSNLIHDLWPKG